MHQNVIKGKWLNISLMKMNDASDLFLNSSKQFFSDLPKCVCGGGSQWLKMFLFFFFFKAA